MSWSGLLLALAVAAAMASPSRAAGKVLTQTIVLLRHGERADAGIGQLSCQGLNRALALPAKIVGQFGRPDFLFAPDPGKVKDDFGKPYSYVRPLATIEPTGIMLGLPVDATVGFDDIGTLARRLDTQPYRNATIVIAWEHHRLVDLTRDLLAAHGGPAAKVPDWGRDDFDGLFVVRVRRDGDMVTSSFERMTQGLDGLPKACPAAAAFAPARQGRR